MPNLQGKTANKCELSMIFKVLRSKREPSYKIVGILRGHQIENLCFSQLNKLCLTLYHFWTVENKPL